MRRAILDAIVSSIVGTLIVTIVSAIVGLALRPSGQVLVFGPVSLPGGRYATTIQIQNDS